MLVETRDYKCRAFISETVNTDCSADLESKSPVMILGVAFLSYSSTDKTPMRQNLTQLS